MPARLQGCALIFRWPFKTFLKLRVLAGTFAGAAVAA